MVSFWPWKGDDTSPASFEKALSTLLAKISKASSKLDNLRQRSRRFNVLWTLYAGFAYLLCSIILILVVGWRKWGVAEYAAVAGGPVIIYIVRLALTTYYDYRTSLVQAQLDGLEGQRNQTIEKLKTATKYNSTQELLKKYGGTPTPKEKSTRKPESKGTTQQDGTGTPRNERTKFVPPPTANIPRGVQSPNSQRMPPQTPHRRVASPTAESSPLWQRPAFPRESSAEFAANAFSAPPQYAPINESPRWFDRIIDVLLGEDESLPGKRLALICKNCRLVNGQAPPGAKRIEDVGKWQCAACGTMNGEENEVTSMLASIKDQVPEDKAGDNGEPTDEKAAATADAGHESDVTQYSSKEGGSEKHTKEAVTPRRRSTRTRKRDKEED